MAVSTAPTAVTNLLAAINARTEVQNPPAGFAIGVVRGAPLDDQPLDEAIVIRQVQRTLQRLEMVGISAGFGYLREDYVIPVEVFVWRGGDDAVSVEARAWTLIAAVESAIRTDVTLAGAVLEAWPEATDFTSEWDDTSSGRRVIARVDVHCWAQI